MCKPFDKLMFCTCEEDNVQHSDYWIVYRYVGGQKKIVGKMLLPLNSPKLKYEEQKSCLLTRLKEENVFDIPISFQEKDILKIVLTSNLENPFHYTFEYQTQVWNDYVIDPFTLKSKYEATKRGNLSFDID